jgi:hypothetical protein
MASTDTTLMSLDFLPGFHRESTKYAEEGKWFDGNRVRFREGKPENLRGYEKFSTDTIEGFARDILTWTDNTTRKYVAYGTNKQLYVVQNETRYDSTPITTAVSVNNNFTTTSGSAIVKVDVGFTHGVSASDRVVFSGVDTFAGTSVNGVKAITSVSGTQTFFVSANVTANATSATTGGTNGTISLLLKNEESNNIQGLGYGAGPYNAGVSITGERAWNEAATQSAITLLAAQWTLDTNGEDLLALRRGGQLMHLDVSDNNYQIGRATIVSTAPYANTFLASPNDGHIVCYGASTTATDTNIEPLRVAWSDQNSYTVWEPSATNTAGGVVLTEGSRIIGAIRSRNTINIWTDKAMYIQNFVGAPFIFRFTQVGSNCGLIATHAAVDIDGVSYWMGENNFYMYDGRVNTMPCTIRRYLFDSFNMTQKDKVFAGINNEFKEIIWLYPLTGSDEPNGYVIYNYAEDTWVYGKLFSDGIVTTFADRDVYDSTLTTGYTSATADSYLFNNEPQGIFTGDEEVKFSVRTRNYPSDSFQEKGPFGINSNTRKINMRARGRQSVVKVSATSNGSWRWGSVRLALQPDGER